jgi:hypothetical protein
MDSTIPSDLLELKDRFETWRINRKYVRELILRTASLRVESKGTYGKLSATVHDCFRKSCTVAESLRCTLQRDLPVMQVGITESRGRQPLK